MAENNNSPKRKKPVKVSFGISWLYIILLIGIGYMFFNQGGTVDWVFILSGLFLMVEGVLALADAVGLK